MIPCKECIALVMCRNKEKVECERLTFYAERIWKTANTNARYKKIWVEINKTLPNMSLVRSGPRGFGKTMR